METRMNLQDSSESRRSLVRPDNFILEFLEAAIHQLLFVTGLYPTGIFTRKQKYGSTVQMSTHPDLNKYITQCLKGAQELLKRNELNRIVLLFSNERGKPIKKFVFDVKSLLSEIMIDRNDEQRLEHSLRDMFLRVAVCDRQIKPLPKNCTFKVLLSTLEQSHINLSKNPNFEDFPWVRTNPQDVNMEQTETIPVSSLEFSGIKMQVYAEEGVQENSGEELLLGLASPLPSTQSSRPTSSASAINTQKDLFQPSPLV